MVGAIASDISSSALNGIGASAATRKAVLETGFPGLKVFGDPEQKAADSPREPKTGRAATALADGNTLLAAQQQGGDAATSQDDKPKAPGELSEEEKQQVAKLKQIDAKVRAHERAHAAVGGQYAGAPSYGYTRGPDGQSYATSGEVPIDIGAEKDPHATLQKAAQVAAAALAPADPSGQDRAVAAAAAQLRLQALGQIREEARAKQDAEAAKREAGHAESQPGREELPGGGESPPAAGQAGPAARAAQAYANQAYATQAYANQSYANDNPGGQSGRLAGLSA